jgi:hypothetical protein
MTVAKCGIYREIDESRLQEYADKGYAPVEEPAEKPAKKPAKE